MELAGAYRIGFLSNPGVKERSPVRDEEREWARTLGVLGPEGESLKLDGGAGAPRFRAGRAPERGVRVTPREERLRSGVSEVTGELADDNGGLAGSGSTTRDGEVGRDAEEKLNLGRGIRDSLGRRAFLIGVLLGLVVPSLFLMDPGVVGEKARCMIVEFPFKF